MSSLRRVSPNGALPPLYLHCHLSREKVDGSYGILQAPPAQEWYPARWVDAARREKGLDLSEPSEKTGALLLERLDIEMCSIYSLQDCCSLICCSLPHSRLQLWNLCLSLFAESESIEFPLTRSMKLIFDGTGVFEELHVNFIARRRQLLIETIH